MSAQAVRKRGRGTSICDNSFHNNQKWSSG